MENSRPALNHFLVDVFNEILKTEEACVADSGFSDLSLREMHVIEAVSALAETNGNSAAEVASALRITAGSLTTAVSLLERKGYLTRFRDDKDKRVVRIVPTDSGREANRVHKAFHEEMVGYVLTALSPEEAVLFVRSLKSVSDFFKLKYKEKIGGSI
jgi:DNA-binding MarR family transcriptional regulator